MTGSHIVFISTSMTSNDVHKKIYIRQNIFLIAENIVEVYIYYYGEKNYSENARRQCEILSSIEKTFKVRPKNVQDFYNL
jgi:hypothetical protein